MFVLYEYISPGSTQTLYLLKHIELIITLIYYEKINAHIGYMRKLLIFYVRTYVVHMLRTYVILFM